MTTTLQPDALRRVERLDRIWEERPGVLGWLTTTDHKRIGLLCLFTSLAFFAAGGAEALLIRTQLIVPNGTTLSPAAFDTTMTMHGVTMIFLFVIPISTGAFGNYLVPLMIGSRDMAFPRLNALSYWIYVMSGIYMYASFVVGQAPSCGWFCYSPLGNKLFTPDRGTDFYSLGLMFLTVSSTIGAINFIVTIFKLRAPGMSLNRLPLFCWANLATMFSVIFAMPALTSANLMQELDRKFDFRFFQPKHGGDT